MNLSNITNINNYMRNSSESVKLSQRSENYYINNTNSKKEDIYKTITKSNTYDKRNDQSTSFNIINLNDNMNNNIQKSRTCRENENIYINRTSSILHLINLNQNHLETVLETVSEASNSKIDSSEISNENENNSNKIESKDDINENDTGNKKTKEETINNSEHKINGSDFRINDSENNTTTKKSLYFPVKTH